MRAAKVLSILYLWTVVLGGVLLLARLFTGIDLDFSVELAVLILIVMASEWLVVSFPHGQLSAAYAITLGAFLLYGPAAAAWVTALGVLFGQGIANRGNPVRTTLFNGAQSVLTVYGAYWVYLLCGGVPYPGSLLTLVNIPALLAFSAGYFLINHLLVYVYLLPRRRVNLVGWRETLGWDASTYLFLVPLGFLVAVVHQEAGFTGAALVLLLSLVLQLFLRRHIRVELNNREMGILYEVARRLGTSSPADGLLDLILREARQIIPYHTAMICLWSEERGLFVPAAVRSPYAAELKDVLWERDTGIVGWAVQSREPCLVTDARSDPRLEQELGLSQFLRSLIFIPLAYEDEVLGIFVIGDRRPGVYCKHNLHILTIVGGLATVALDNTRLHHRLKKTAGHDPLTGLPNRYQFWRHLQSELHRTRSQDQPLAVILIEVDQLCVLNGRYGFAVGDYALVQFARALEDRVGARGTVARYGGDGFALLLPEFGEIRATEIAERLQRAVEQISFGVEGREERVRLSVRIGLAVSPLDGATADELLRKAESHLYASGEPVIAGASPAGGSRGRA